MYLETAVKPSRSVYRGSIELCAQGINSRLPQIDQQCEAIAVIPAYREFEGGRIVGLLEEMQAQSIGSRRFETILVVNNPRSLDVSDQAGLEDNLKLLVYFNEQKQAGNFSNVHVIDCTGGEIQARHMGLVRGLGQLVAENRLSQTHQPDKGVIIQLDADVSVNRDFVSKLLEAYKYPYVHSAMIGRIPLPIDFQSDDYYATYATLFAHAVLYHHNRNGGFCGDGPTLSFRASCHKDQRTRSYMDFAMNEDYALGKDLSRLGGMYLLAEPRVYKADRIRPDGFDSVLRLIWVMMGDAWQVTESLVKLVYAGTDISKEQFNLTPRNKFWEMIVANMKTVDPEAVSRLNTYLVQEEEFVKRSMDWDNLNPFLKVHGLYLYAFSRLAMGDNQMLSLPAKTDDSKGIIRIDMTGKNFPR